MLSPFSTAALWRYSVLHHTVINLRFATFEQPGSVAQWLESMPYFPNQGLNPHFHSQLRRHILSSTGARARGGLWLSLPASQHCEPEVSETHFVEDGPARRSAVSSSLRTSEGRGILMRRMLLEDDSCTASSLLVLAEYEFATSKSPSLATCFSAENFDV